ncbi:hypothetical protein BKA67DRAFT_655036 [Truncatella angustata]|uniref:Uncharacterized protein n=1 Tax=Truncatella angustata TaxID=152316 RepID=A0A9P8UR62_9PEZI|nr:uncharacterized protein BKA67DRAFT_655036 [Truncatella angustata]KAH6656724.1 hypothetical protein BKA67DRAFT_655036 [Truncatella angustata]
MGLILRDDGGSLSVNPPLTPNGFTTNGSNWLWAVTAVYVVIFLFFAATSFKAFNGERIFHYTFIVPLLVGSIVYYSWASDLGSSVVSGWQLFWVKYIYWVVEFPAIIVALGLLSGISWATIVYNVFLSWIWIVSYLVAAFTTTQYKWGFFAFGTVSWLILAVHLLTIGRKSATRVGVSAHYTGLAGWTNLLWLVWPIAWAVTDGARVIGVTPTAIFFGVLDILLLPVIALAFFFVSRKWDYNRLNLAYTRYGRVNDGGHHQDKLTTPAPAHGGVNTAAPAV